MSYFSFTVEKGLALQSEQLQGWEGKLSNECFKALKAYLEQENAKLKPSASGYNVLRGQDLVVFIMNWVPEKD